MRKLLFLLLFASLFAETDLEKIQRISELIEINPNQTELLIIRARLHASMAELQMAEEDLTRYLEIHPGDVDALNMRAKIFALQGRYDDAIEDLARALAKNKNDITTLTNLGDVHLQRSEPGDAIRYFSKVLKLDSEHLEVLTNRGNAFFQIGKHKLAIMDFQKALAIDPSDKRAQNGLGLATLQDGDAEAARDIFLQLTEAHPDYVHAHINLSKCHQALNEWMDAANSLNTALNLDSQNFEALLEFGKLDIIHGHFEKALVNLDKAFAIDPYNIDVLVNRAIGLHKKGKGKEAQQLIDRANYVGAKIPKDFLKNYPK